MSKRTVATYARRTARPCWRRAVQQRDTGLGCLSGHGCLERVVHDEHVVGYGPQQRLPQFHVLRVWQIGVARRRIGKGHDKAPIKPVRLALGTVVVPAADRLDSRN